MTTHPSWRWTWVTGRVLLSILFLASGASKLAFHAAIAGAVGAAGFPAADLLAWGAGLFEIAAGVALVLGFRLFETSLLLAAWCLVTALFFHRFWAATGVEQQAQVANFLKNVALVGAFLILAGLTRRRDATETRA